MADTQTHAQIILSKIESVLEGRIDADVESYEIAGRKITKIPIWELVKLRQTYQRERDAEIRAEKLAQGLPTGRKVRVRF